MNKVIGICNLHNEPHLGEITKNRPLGSVTFLGRYGIIDFTLSNFSNSGIEKVYVLVRKGITALRRHIGSGAIYTRNTKLGHIELLFNEKGFTNKAFNTDVNNLRQSLDLDEVDFEYAVIAPTYMLSSIDYRPIIEAHIASGAQITTVYKHVEDADKEYLRCDKYKFNAAGNVSKVSKNIGRASEADVSLDTFIINKRTLKKLLNEAPKISQFFSLQDVINFFIEENMMDVHGYQFDGFVVPILSLDNYVTHSLDLLNYHVRNRLFIEDWPIYTTTHSTPPALYGKDADVKNSFISNGAVIKGKVHNCIISREVVIEKGAEVKNSIIFTKTVVGRDVKLDHILSDKGATIVNIKKLTGTDDDFVVISQGAKI